jgi:hypothetical protein
VGHKHMCMLHPAVETPICCEAVRCLSAHGGLVRCQWGASTREVCTEPDGMLAPPV